MGKTQQVKDEKYIYEKKTEKKNDEDKYEKRKLIDKHSINSKEENQSKIYAQNLSDKLSVIFQKKMFIFYTYAVGNFIVRT